MRLKATVCVSRQGAHRRSPSLLPYSRCCRARIALGVAAEVGMGPAVAVAAEVGMGPPVAAVAASGSLPAGGCHTVR